MTDLLIASSNKADTKALKLGESKYDSFLAKVSRLTCRFTKLTYHNKLRALRTGQCLHFHSSTRPKTNLLLRVVAVAFSTHKVNSLNLTKHQLHSYTLTGTVKVR